MRHNAARQSEDAPPVLAPDRPALTEPVYGSPEDGASESPGAPGDELTAVAVLSNN